MVDDDPKRIALYQQPALTKLSCFTVCDDAIWRITPSGDARDLRTQRDRDDFVAEVLKVCWAKTGNVIKANALTEM
jgi:hypothetical protein